ncbi:MAG: hypothetical protein JKY23_00425 [Nitrospinaceae bacterium]|nr:hypothetical protein [Nitrospinaceae bacterium]
MTCAVCRTQGAHPLTTHHKLPGVPGISICQVDARCGGVHVIRCGDLCVQECLKVRNACPPRVDRGWLLDCVVCCTKLVWSGQDLLAVNGRMCVECRVVVCAK